MTRHAARLLLALQHGGGDVGLALGALVFVLRRELGITWRDAIDVAETLIKTRLTAKEHLAIIGTSAGGVMVGGAVNERPDLFAAVHSAVPFVDVMNTMMDASLPLTVGEMRYYYTEGSSSVLFGWIILGEQPSLLTLIGGAVTLAGVAWVQSLTRKQR